MTYKSKQSLFSSKFSRKLGLWVGLFRAGIGRNKVGPACVVLVLKMAVQQSIALATEKSLLCPNLTFRLTSPSNRLVNAEIKQKTTVLIYPQAKVLMRTPSHHCGYI